jgi:hypothetical protein
MFIFWPIKTGQTFFDVWTIFHLSFWIFMGSNFWNIQKFINRPQAMLIGICLSYVWEIFERYAERKWPNIWLSPESFINSYISDPMTCVIGILFAWFALDNWRY